LLPLPNAIVVLSVFLLKIENYGITPGVAELRVLLSGVFWIDLLLWKVSLFCLVVTASFLLQFPGVIVTEKLFLFVLDAQKMKREGRYFFSGDLP
jgi:hypothetical protein